MRAEAEPRQPPRRPVRRWPTVLAALGVAGALVLTAFLVVQDRSNANAANSSPANEARDAAAVKSLRSIARSMAYADEMADLGVVGLRNLELHTYLADVVSPLGGTLTLSSGGWTLALGSGWGCLTWARRAGARVSIVARGICPGAPINATPPASAAAVREALDRASGVQRAAALAAFAAAAAAPPGSRVPVSLLERVFEGHASSLPFRWDASSIGVSIVTDASSACLRPVHHRVAVSLGTCAH